MMKKLFSLLLLLAFSAALLAGCSAGGTTPPADTAETAAPTEPTAPDAGSADGAADAAGLPEASEPAEPVDVNILALKGPTAMGMVQFMREADAGNLTDNAYHFSITAVTDEVSVALAQGTADIAAVPANLASILYNNTEGGVRVLAINTLGVLYIVERGDTVQSLADLAGKTLYASGKGTTPEYALNYLLAESGLEGQVTVEWKSEQAECLSALMSDEDAIAMLPQPFVTTAQAQDDSIQVALDLTAEWDALQAGSDAPSTLVTGVVVARTEFAEAHPEVISAFLDHYAASVDFVNGNVAEAAQLVGQSEIVTAEVAEQALPQCNIVFIEGDEMREKLSGYLSVLLAQNPQSVGGALPGDDFYYVRQAG